jgi:hypothetical protein
MGSQDYGLIRPPAGTVIKLKTLLSLLTVYGREIERSNDRVGKYARDIDVNALTLMHGGLTHPADASLGDPLCSAKRVKKNGLNLMILPWGTED